MEVAEPTPEQVLVGDRPRLDRTSTATRVADILRTRIAEGVFPPGTRLSEETISEALGVSRNTLRESFRLLSRERLVVHEMNRGVFIRKLTADDIVDLYRVRRIIECGAIRYAGEPSPTALADMQGAIQVARDAARERRWLDVGTASIRFHLAIASLSGSDRVVELAQQIMTEFRLTLPAIPEWSSNYEASATRHAAILKPLRKGDLALAEQLLDAYLVDGERELLALYEKP